MGHFIVLLTNIQKKIKATFFPINYQILIYYNIFHFLFWFCFSHHSDDDDYVYDDDAPDDENDLGVDPNKLDDDGR